MIRAPAAIALDTLVRSCSTASASAVPPPVTSKCPVIRTAAKPGRSPSSSMCRILASSSLSITGNGTYLPAGRRGGLHQVLLRAETAAEAGHELLADGIQRRVGHLREQLAEVVEEQPGAVDRAATGVSVPMEPIGSAPDEAIGVMRMRSSSSV